ncbi:MAG TPA: hypothetical protein GX736_01385 [Mogibacterium sp.]|nr:hypothetical protein [Mogibacterium sp.]
MRKVLFIESILIIVLGTLGLAVTFGKIQPLSRGIQALFCLVADAGIVYSVIYMSRNKEDEKHKLAYIALIQGLIANLIIALL